MSTETLRRFKLKRGIHAQKEKGKIRTYLAGTPGEVIETPEDLNKQHDPRKERFEPVEEFVPISQTPGKAGDGLEELGIKGLRELAAQEEIDLGDLTKKSDIVAVIRSHTVVSG